ncbi:MAG: beta-ketoacyl-[acyl-carrier-protein] synthase family protein [Bacteroidales bacterium]|nr:beta-ketoacyl-[acyl-carrier-protein] synthase family protein [Bacteroidales bacterium]MDD4058343.1 beta-ketoacyl-[acyl-carrier-protein] synthase family protein [Bacteroidales bacterium]
MANEVFVAGLGCVSALGYGVSKQREALITGASGIVPLTLFETIHEVMAGEVAFSNEELRVRLGLSEGKEYSRTTLLGLAAAREALEESAIEMDDLKIGFISATSVGGMDVSEIFYREYLPDNRKGRLRKLIGHDCGASTQFIYENLNLNGFCSTINTACSSANNAIMMGARMIKAGLIDAVIAGGTDSLCRFTVNGFSSLGILDGELCKPFDSGRKGLNLGEGAGYLLLVSDKVKSKKRYCRVAGYANANDAFHQTASSSNGEGAFLAMKGAVEMSNHLPDEIGYINVHGTGTQNNDASEAVALKRVFGENVPPFSSTKGFTGHTLGAAGGVESVFTILALDGGYIWPNLNFKDKMDECDRPPQITLKRAPEMRAAMTNSFGFGGNCSTLIFDKV